MVWVGPRDVVTRPGAGCALPWNASFMTIPFEVGIFAKAPIRFELPLEPATLGPFGPGVSPFTALLHVSYVVGVVEFQQTRVDRPTGCGPLSRSFNFRDGGYPPGTPQGGYPPCGEHAVQRPECWGDTPQHLSQPSRPARPPTACWRRVPLIPASRGTMLASARQAVGPWACGGGLSRSAPPHTKTERAVIVSA